MSKKEGDPPVELECQFILRLPEVILFYFEHY